jgi:glycosyltransferase involved in cell wall biosynthesis
MLSYVLVTPAHNEQEFIELTIRSVISQTVLPKKWIIVSDGSTDRTDEIVQSYAEKYMWIEHVELPKRQERHFAGKARAFNLGCDKVKDENFDIIGNLDADISFGNDFFEYLLAQFMKMPELGVAGTHYIEGDFHSFKDSYINVHHVNGQCQLFRKKCLQKIGGYQPIKDGGIDWVAVTTARMNGWKTYSFSERVYMHHRKMGTANRNVLKARYHYGKKDYLFGGHPIWQIFRGIFQFKNKPYIIGGLLLITGYLWAGATRKERPVSMELKRFHRKEQMQRLRNLIANKLTLNRVKTETYKDSMVNMEKEVKSEDQNNDIK